MAWLRGRWHFVGALLLGCGSRSALDDLSIPAGLPSKGASAGSGGSIGDPPPPVASGMAGTATTMGGAPAQIPPPLEVIKTVDGDDELELHDMAVAPNGNVALVGEFVGDVYGLALGGPDEADSWVASIDPLGSPRWATMHGESDSDDALYGVVWDDQGVIATGTAANSLVRGRKLEWTTKSFPNAVGMDVALGPNGEVAMAGWLDDDTDFGGGVLEAEPGTAVVVGYDSDGNWRWNRALPGIESYATDVAVDAAGNTLVAGHFIMHIDLGVIQDSTNSVYPSVFLAKLDPSGTPIDATTIVSDGSIEPRGLAVTADGGFVLAARLVGTIELGASTISGTGAAFVARFDQDGEVLWTRVIDSSGEVEPSAVALTSLGDVLLVGSFTNILDTPSSPYTSKDSDIDGFVVALRGGNGEILWDLAITGNEEQSVSAIAVDTTANVDTVYVGGSFDEIVSVNGMGRIPVTDGGNIFVAKLTL